GLSPGANLGPAQIGSTQRQLDLAERYALANLLRLDRYLSDISAQGPFQIDVDLGTRGAIWQYLRYALDRDGRDQHALLSGLVNSRSFGFPNLEAVFGTDPREWLVDNMVSLYVDDVVNGIGA